MVLGASQTRRQVTSLLLDKATVIDSETEAALDMTRDRYGRTVHAGAAAAARAHRDKAAVEAYATHLAPHAEALLDAARLVLDELLPAGLRPRRPSRRAPTAPPRQTPAARPTPPPTPRPAEDALLSAHPTFQPLLRRPNHGRAYALDRGARLLPQRGS